jgi:hypothetical protein
LNEWLCYAAKATFDLNAGLWPRRGRLLMAFFYHQHYPAFRQISHLFYLFSFPEQPLAKL